MSVRTCIRRHCKIAYQKKLIHMEHIATDIGSKDAHNLSRKQCVITDLGQVESDPLAHTYISGELEQHRLVIQAALRRIRADAAVRIDGFLTCTSRVCKCLNVVVFLDQTPNVIDVLIHHVCLFPGLFVHESIGLDGVLQVVEHGGFIFGVVAAKGKVRIVLSIHDMC